MTIGKAITSKIVWDTFKSTYLQTDFAHAYQLEMDIWNLRQQPHQRISEFHSQMTALWDQLALNEPARTHSHTEYQILRELTKLVQFLLTFSDDFEALRSSILHQKPLLTATDVFPELLIEQTQKAIHAHPSADTAFLAASNRSSYSNSSSSSKSMGKKPYCIYYRKSGHWK